MRLTELSRAVGLPLARGVPAAAGRIPLLAAGAVVSGRHEQHLAGQGVRAVWVDDDLSRGIAPRDLLPEEIRAEAATAVHDALGDARAAIAASRPLPDVRVRALARVVDRILRHLANGPPGTLVVHDLSAADQYVHRHAVSCTALGLHLARAQFQRNGWIDPRGARRFDDLDERLSVLGLGLLLHDFGKMALPPRVLDKPGPLDRSESALVRRHPGVGAALVRGHRLNPLVTSVIHDHHERIDGEGYPRRLRGAAIHQLAAIAAVADVYTAMISERPYRAAAPAHEAWDVVVGGELAAFDPEVVATFRSLVAPFPLGTEVVLADGRSGVVCDVDPDRVQVPVVRVAGPDGPVELPVDTRTGLAA